MKPLRIAFVTPFFPLKGGIARFSGLLRDALLDRGYDVVPVAFKALYPDFLSQGAVDADPASDPVFPDEVRLVLYNPFSWFGTIRSIRSLHPDILLVAYWTGVLAPFYYVLRRLTGVKMVVLLHNLSAHESFFFDPFMSRLLSAFADGFVTLSKSVFQEVSAAMPEIPVLPLFHPIYEPERDIPPREYGFVYMFLSILENVCVRLPNHDAELVAFDTKPPSNFLKVELVGTEELSISQIHRKLRPLHPLFSNNRLSGVSCPGVHPRKA